MVWRMEDIGVEQRRCVSGETVAIAKLSLSALEHDKLKDTLGRMLVELSRVLTQVSNARSGLWGFAVIRPAELARKQRSSTVKN